MRDVVNTTVTNKVKPSEQIRICALQKVKRLLHMNPALMERDGVFHAPNLPNGPFEARERVRAVLA
tara:strand:- start:416 stop:613 length:198 start_codon:yes stop_codon:yes gene_type:complete